MDDSLSQALIRLPKKAVRRLAWQRGDGLAVFEGQAWITQVGETGDTVLGRGESRTFPGAGDLLVEAFADAVLIRLRAGDRIEEDTPLSSDTERPMPPPSAYTLMRATRELRHAQVGQALWRAASALIRGAVWLVAAAGRAWQASGVDAAAGARRVDASRRRWQASARAHHGC
jgi:Protein of unknown function (DUF2917)